MKFLQIATTVDAADFSPFLPAVKKHRKNKKNIKNLLTKGKMRGMIFKYTKAPLAQRIECPATNR